MVPIPHPVDGLANGPNSGPDSVRAARPADVEAIGAVHARSWSGPYAAVLPAGVRERVDARQLAAAWRPAVESPPSPRHRVLVAVGGGLVTGFAAVAPSADADADASAVELVALEVDPGHGRRGHGSRLLAAVADTARDSGASRLHAWILDGDEPRERFLASAGLGRDGGRRTRAVPSEAVPDELASGTGTGTGTGTEPAARRLRVDEVRLSAWLVEPGPG